MKQYLDLSTPGLWPRSDLIHFLWLLGLMKAYRNPFPKVKIKI